MSGRKKKPKAQRRTIEKKVYLSPNDMRLLKPALRTREFSDFCRELLLKAARKEPTP